jgi:anti-anti-sigma factor
MSDAFAFGATPDEFDVTVDHVRRTVTIYGELDIATVPLMVEAARPLQNTPDPITVDLQEVIFIDAGALGALVALRNQQTSNATILRVIGNAKVVRIVGLIGLDSLISTDANVSRLTTPPDPDPFDRYKQASIAHQSLQAARWDSSVATAETPVQAQATEAALAESATELNAARADYLRDPGPDSRPSST